MPDDFEEVLEWLLRRADPASEPIEDVRRDADGALLEYKIKGWGPSTWHVAAWERAGYRVDNWRNALGVSTLRIFPPG